MARILSRISVAEFGAVCIWIWRYLKHMYHVSTNIDVYYICPVSGGSPHMGTTDLRIFFSSVDLNVEATYAPRGVLRCDRLVCSYSNHYASSINRFLQAKLRLHSCHGPTAKRRYGSAFRLCGLRHLGRVRERHTDCTE
jgi:hypothetical protein